MKNRWGILDKKKDRPFCIWAVKKEKICLFDVF